MNYEIKSVAKIPDLMTLISVTTPTKNTSNNTVYLNCF
jgi:hypothetical protein